MTCSRYQAIKGVAERRCEAIKPCAPFELNYYGDDVFNEEAIRRLMRKDTAEILLQTMAGRRPFEKAIAGEVAEAMKEWALSRGATHFTHWFQPLTGGTAEKHDAFLEPAGVNKAILSFSAKNLVGGETDASSFPSGGLRSTFEARGYTAWDPTSPAFIKRHANGATLCIPTAFCSYTGEVLDRKTPLLRSIQALSHSVSRLMKCFGYAPERTTITLGPEQEYFLIDRNFYFQRPDLVQTGRTLFGAPPSKHQQLEDHYMGAIKPRILAFMNEVEETLWHLGIPAKTRHNEAAPAQFELAPVFEELNLSIDHNMVIMQVLREVAERYGFVCLLHEKPYAGVNGSGKHNNWSLNYGDRNLLDPGDTPQDNALFLTVLSSVIRATHLHSDLLRSTTASAGNDHRLGAAEAPPAIISIFLGDQLSAVIDEIVDGKSNHRSRKCEMKIGVDTLPTLPRDATDRNRTSPFAFTGNKFEFRGCGSSQSCSNVNVVLNTIVAESLDFFSEHLERLSKRNFNAGLQALLKEVLAAHRQILFNGDGYTDEWKKEAARRGLPNLQDTTVALQPLLDKKNQALFETYAVFTGKELESRHAAFLEQYQRKVHIEALVAVEMATSTIAPVVARQYHQMMGTLASTCQAGFKAEANRAFYNDTMALGKGYAELRRCTQALQGIIRTGNEPAMLQSMAKLRRVVDALELLVDDGAWPLPKYREMLFIY